MSGRKPGQAKAKLARDAKRRAADFHAGIDAARAAIAPLIMRRYFVRGLLTGMAIGAALVAGALAVVRWLL